MEQRYAAAVVIYNELGEVLLARRSAHKVPHPNVLSLPSTYIRNKDGSYVHLQPSDEGVREQLTDAVKKKLGLDIIIEDEIGKMEGQQSSYWLHMTDYFAKFTGGIIIPNGDDFSEALFVNPLEKLAGKDRSKMGFCTQTLLGKLDDDPIFWKKYFP